MFQSGQRQQTSQTQKYLGSENKNFAVKDFPDKNFVQNLCCFLYVEAKSQEGCKFLFADFRLRTIKALISNNLKWLKPEDANTFILRRKNTLINLPGYCKHREGHRPEETKENQRKKTRNAHKNKIQKHGRPENSTNQLVQGPI